MANCTVKFVAFAPVLLERKADLIRKSMDPEKGAQREVRTVFDGADRQYVHHQCSILMCLLTSTPCALSWKHIFAKALVRPFKLFYREPIIQLLGLYMAFIYGVLYREQIMYHHARHVGN